MDHLVQQAASLNGVALIGVLDRALRAPNVYSFSELLNLPNVQALASTEHASKLSLLELFAYGTYTDYKASQATCGTLSDPLLTKLKQLSIVSMASHKKILPYTEIQQTLDIPSIDDIEPLLISCIYSGLIEGTLDQRTSACYITSTVGRDVTNEQLDGLLTLLSRWQNNITDTLNVLDQQMKMIVTAKVQESTEENNFQKKLKDNLKDMDHPRESHRSAMQRGAFMKGDVSDNLLEQVRMENLMHPQHASTAGRSSDSTTSSGPYSEEDINRMLVTGQSLNDGTDANRQVKRERRNDPSSTTSMTASSVSTAIDHSRMETE